jgi:hypothetical protein
MMPPNNQNGIEMLKMQAESLQSARDSINRRMEKLEKSND